MEQKKYWQSFGERNNSESFQKNAQDEFKEDLPFENLDGKEEKTPRRDFLKYLGFSTAAAMAAASCEIPVRKAIPFVNRPQDIVPGVADYYATTYVSGGDAISIVAKVRDGRPIKIEGNELSSVTGGSTTARVQASVLDLYDTSRLRFPMASGKEVTTFDAFDKMVTQELGGTSLVLLTATITSPSTKKIITEFLAKYPGSRHVQYDAVSYTGILLANEASYGKRAIPSYDFGKAKVIVSLGADFLGTWLNAVEYQKGYAAGRKVNQANPQMNKHYQFESFMSMTGANADDRFTHKPSETGVVALALLNAIGGQPVSGVDDKLKKAVAKVAADLNANKGAGLVVCGSNNPDVQIIVNAINEAIGASGNTINWSAPLLTKQGLDADMATLVADMEAGKVSGLLVYDANPAYDYPAADKFKAAIKKVKTTVSFNSKMDETAALCKYIIPSHHYLESWGDAEPKSGYFSMIQPTIAPLFKTRQFQDSLLKWSGNPSTYEVYFRQYWTGILGSDDTFNKALQDGVVEPASPSLVLGGASYNTAALGTASAAVSSVKSGGRFELALYEKIGVGDGRHANNPWLQELPDPITKATWDNYAMVSPQFGKEFLKIDLTDDKKGDDDTYEANPEKPVIRIKSGNKELLLPAMIVPGMNPDTIAVAIGYGRGVNNDAKEEETENAKLHIGRAGGAVGKNAYPFASFNGRSIEWTVTGITVEPTGEEYRIATTQTHSSYEGRKEVVKEMTLSEYKQHPTHIRDERAKELEPWGGLENYDKEGTLYPMYDRPGIKWGMSIDLNSCYGCGACVVACHAENNVPVVGKPEVLRFHDMHWLRIDRYFSGDPNNPESIQTVFQPMLCQHCDNAPCENVCPVAATVHNSEGINQMIYNRCIGTRYCANNCPYKVRRFNWADYQGADSFGDNQQDHISDVTLMMNDDLTRMVLNPDVTVRSRGVMEKCTFCVQRLQAGKLQAKKENRVLTDKDAQTACQQACASDAIVFGNANNADSILSKSRRENSNRVFYSLEQIHTLPNVNYLAKIRNTEVLYEEAGEHIRFKDAEGTASPASESHH